MMFGNGGYWGYEKIDSLFVKEARDTRKLAVPKIHHQEFEPSDEWQENRILLAIFYTKIV